MTLTCLFRITALCLPWEQDGSRIAYAIELRNWPDDGRGCGRDLLDSLLRQCGNINKFSCVPWYQSANDMPLTVPKLVRFDTEGTVSQDCVLEAVFQANPNNVTMARCL